MAFDVGALPVAEALGPTPPPWLSEWLQHPDDDEYWSSRRPDLSAIEVPVFTVLGYFDDFSSGTAVLAEALGAEAVCGPWAHMPWGTRHGGTELGDEAGPGPAFPRLVAFFDRVFERQPPIEADRRVSYYCIGAGWRSAPTWPPGNRWQQWCGVSGGNANSRHGDGRLRPGDEPAGPADVVVVEPLVPYPGGAIGFQDESGSEDRRDVLCYTSEPLDAPLEVVGSPLVNVEAACDHADHDLVVTLVLVDPDGEARALTGSARRCRSCSAGSPMAHALRLRPIAVQAPAGHRLRLDVSGARFPAFDRNPHSGVPPAQARAEDTVVATLTVHGLRMELPVNGHE